MKMTADQMVSLKRNVADKKNHIPKMYKSKPIKKQSKRSIYTEKSVEM